MSREILFRGKSVDTHEWVYGHYIHQYGAHEIVFPEGTGADGFDSRHIDPATICQYTGLTDKRGNKIFEGDILRVPYRKDDDCIVEWHDGSFRLRWANEDRRAEYGNDYNAVCCVQKVVERRNIIGNIFDHKTIINTEEN